MNAAYKRCSDKRRSGLILLELNLLFMMIILVSGIYCNSVQGICKNCKKLLADIEIARAARYTESMLRRELSYNTLQTRLSKDFGGKDQIICQKTFKNVRVYWYLSGNTVYRKTVKENAIGINPFSDPKIQVIDFKTVPLGKQKLGILMTLKDTETGLTRKRTFTLILSNAPVES